MLSVLEVISELMLLKVPCHSSLEHDALGPAMLGSLHAALPGSVWYRGCLRTFLFLWVLFPNYWLMGCISCDSFFLHTAALVALLLSGLIKGQMPALQGFGLLKRRFGN